MTLVAGVDSSTQSCKVVIRDAETGALVRSGRRVPPRRHRGRPRGLVGRAAVGDRRRRRPRRRRRDLGRRPAARHGRARRRRRASSAPRCCGTTPARRRRRRPDRRARRGRRRGPTRTGSRAGRVASPSPSCAGCATPSRSNAARVAAVALPHDWLTWRLRGSARRARPDLDALVTDRSRRLAAPATGRPRPATTDRDLLALALGHDARRCPRVLGPAEARRAATRRRRRRSAPAPATTPPPRSALGAAARRRRRLDRHLRHRLRGRRRADGRRDRHRRRASPTRPGAFLPLVVHAERRPRARRHRRAARRRPRRAVRARASRAGRAPTGSCSCPTSRASARRTCPTPPAPCTA